MCIHIDRGLIIIAQPHGGGRCRREHLIRGGGRERHRDRAQRIGGCIVHRHHADILGHFRAVVQREGGRADARDVVVRAGHGGAAHGVVHCDYPCPRAARGDSEDPIGGGFCRVGHLDHTDVWRVRRIVIDGDGGIVVRAELIIRRARTELELHIFRAFAKTIETRHDRDCGACFSGRNHQHARQSLVVDAMYGGHSRAVHARNRIVNGERLRGVTRTCDQEGRGVGLRARHGQVHLRGSCVRGDHIHDLHIVINDRDSRCRVCRINDVARVAADGDNHGLKRFGNIVIDGLDVHRGGR